MPSDASRSKEALDLKRWEVAWNYVNICAGNKTAAYVKWYEDHGETKPAYPAAQAHKFFKTEEMQDLIQQMWEENRKEYAHLRDENIAILRSIASDHNNRKGDRISAIKELDSIMGYAQQNVNLNGKVDSDIEVTITNL